MPITITITDPTPAQIAALFGAADPVMPEIAGGTGEKPKRQPKTKVEDAPLAVEEETPSEAEEKLPTVEEVRAAATKLINSNGREALAERLAAFGAANLTALPAEKRAEFIASLG